MQRVAEERQAQGDVVVRDMQRDVSTYREKVEWRRRVQQQEDAMKRELKEEFQAMVQRNPGVPPQELYRDHFEARFRAFRLAQKQAQEEYEQKFKIVI